MRRDFRRYLIGSFAVILIMGAINGRAVAHEHRLVGRIEMVVGWADEPTFAGFKNGVQLMLSEHENPLLDLGDTLKVEVQFGNEKAGPLPIQRAFGKTYGRPGDYRAPLIPTRAGTYTFHFLGTIKDEKIDQSFTCSEKTFDCVGDTASIEFPAKDPSRAELAGRLERLGPRMESAVSAANDAASMAKTLGIIGIALAGVALVVVFGGRGRAKS